jgi:hypothetical protein
MSVDEPFYGSLHPRQTAVAPRGRSSSSLAASKTAIRRYVFAEGGGPHRLRMLAIQTSQLGTIDFRARMIFSISSELSEKSASPAKFITILTVRTANQKGNCNAKSKIKDFVDHRFGRRHAGKHWMLCKLRSIAGDLQYSPARFALLAKNPMKTNSIFMSDMLGFRSWGP